MPHAFLSAVSSLSHRSSTALPLLPPSPPLLLPSLCLATGLHVHRSGSVVCYDVQDHTPPTMAQFVDFLNSAAASAARGRLLAVHCRGGKGRTGSVCCAWLLYTKVCEDADDALALFALERTELGLGRKKLQGVDTPSQRRYVHQVAAMLQAQAAYFPAGSDPMVTPLAAPLRANGVAVAAGGAVPSGAGGEGGVPDSGSAPLHAVDAAESAANGSSSGGASPVLVKLPACPALALTTFELRCWFALPPKGPIVCAIHTELHGGRRGAGFVTHWSQPLHIEPGVTPPDLLTFSLGGADGSGTSVSGDVRVSVFSLPKLLEARHERVKHGASPVLPFDRASHGPWGGPDGMAPADYSDFAPPGEGAGGEGGGSSAQQQRDARRTVAGKEPGCLFFFLFHTGFVGAADQLKVPLLQMDRAFKNKRREYRWEGEACLRFVPPTAAATPRHASAPRRSEPATPTAAPASASAAAERSDT